MKNLFEHTSSLWARYSDYEIKKDKEGTEYIIPKKDAEIKLYSPMKEAEQLVLDTINLGKKLNEHPPAMVRNTLIIDYAKKYGLMGFITALPTTADFITYEKVYLPKNHFIKKETMDTVEYLDLFFPFEKPDFKKHGTESTWDISGDVTGMALAMTMTDRPQAVAMCLQRNYAEPVDWISTMCSDLAFTCIGSFLYYHDYDNLDDVQKDLFRQGMKAFGAISPTYRIALLDNPSIIWDFNSLIQMVQMMFSFVLADGDSPLRLCKNCGEAYIASRKGTEFCSPKCKNQYNVNKSRKKKDSL